MPGQPGTGAAGSGVGESAAADEIFNDAERCGARADAGRVAGRVARWTTTKGPTATIIGATDTTTDFTNRATATNPPTSNIYMKLTLNDHYIILAILFDCDESIYICGCMGSPDYNTRDLM